MSEASLSRLLQVPNVSIQPGSTERCDICLTDCGTPLNGTEDGELAVRLPCSHIFGSKCIATWLCPNGAANNSCPMCRRELFPKQPQPWLDDEVIEVDPFSWAEDGRSDGSEWRAISGAAIDYRTPLDGVSQWDNGRYELYSESIDPESPVQANAPREEGDSEEEWAREEEEFPARQRPHPDPASLEILNTMCETYSLRLDLPPYFGVTAISQALAEKFYIDHPNEGLFLSSIAAVSVYGTLLLTGAPRTLRSVQDMSGVDGEYIDSLYESFGLARVRAALNEEGVFAVSGREGLETVFRYLDG